MGVALVMEKQQLRGIITDGDIRRALTANGANTLSKTAQELMTSHPKPFIRIPIYLKRKIT